MPKEASVAPKERINIVYRPSLGDAKEQVELPLKLMVMGDFTLKEDETPLEEREPVEIDKDNFQDIMNKQNLGLTINVRDRLSGEEGVEMPVNLQFKNTKDFEPGRVAEQVPELNKLLELRSALSFLKGPLGNVPAFRKRIQSLLEDEDARERLMQELKKED